MNSIFKISTWLETFLKDVKSPIFQISLLIVILVNVFVKIKLSENKKIKDAIKEANVGLLIAYLAHLDLVFAAFWAVFITHLF